MAFHVYILECADKTLYIGYTNNLKLRVTNHNSPKLGAKYTRARQPVKLKYSEKHKTKSAAMKREYALKQLTRNQKLEIIKNK